jgi:hypothetical protein
MRRATVGSILIFLLLAALVVAMQRKEDRKVQAAVACQNELVLIDYWKSLNLISEVKQDGKDLVAKVHWRSWIKLPRTLQLQIGKAAYCPVAHGDKGGVARIEDVEGNEIARVERGKWSSKIFPE